MNRIILVILSVVLAVVLADGDGGRRGGGDFLGRLDTNKDGTITKDEASAAAKGKGGDHLDKLFAKFDANKDGSITADEIKAVKAAKFAEIDTNGDAKISKDEFKAHATAEAAERLDKMFAKQDTDKNGFISKAEIDAAKAAHKAEWEARKAQWAAKGGRGGHNLLDLDTDKDGKVSLAEFSVKAAGNADATARAASFFAKLDADHDGFVTQAEKDAAKASWKGKGGDRKHGGGGDHKGFDFATIDANADGQLSKDEVKAKFQAKADSFGDKIFDRIDANDDGFITQEEKDAAHKGKGGDRGGWKGRRGGSGNAKGPQ